MINILEENNMPRPAPLVLIEKINKNSNKIEQILESDAIWAVFYKDKPINMKSLSLDYFSTTSKYRKVSFSNIGHAMSLAKKLNKEFNCDDFSVYRLIADKKIDDQ